MKHAMMIMAHTDFGQLCRLVKALDHDDVDIYVHVNRRSLDWNPVILDGTTRHSKVFFVERVNIYYCDYSQVEAQKRLLHAAVGNGYDYYHLLSGADLPIHPMDSILKFLRCTVGRSLWGSTMSTMNVTQATIIFSQMRFGLLRALSSGYFCKRKKCF